MTSVALPKTVLAEGTCSRAHCWRLSWPQLRFLVRIRASKLGDDFGLFLAADEVIYLVFRDKLFHMSDCFLQPSQVGFEVWEIMYMCHSSHDRFEGFSGYGCHAVDLGCREFSGNVEFGPCCLGRLQKCCADMDIVISSGDRQGIR
ncbi:hypothetical protein FOQG_10912 [Fusarium oxysporum f. sp. raphani 54005]|uniref:Uncharacterized protein n=1 Tax=Fusarium oxysporum f. sp. raphani 54005 TaxID=1089458 RepID=X0C2E8_FUSOX|nr:hypothetical protein FOQG_10912 [Fusarium oxysporum f. sp. raphani 54005]